MIYLAGVPGNGKPGICKRERDLNKYWKSRLWSYFHLINTNGKMNKKNKIDLFLDSGAFSAWTQGVEIDIQEYIDFIKKHEKSINVYANLDVISSEKIGNEKSAKDTLKNQKIMEKADLSPLPVFHYGEPISYLKNYVENYEYIGIGGMVPVSNNQLVLWLDNLFSNFLCDKKGLPKIKVHGFGLTGLKLMLRYPWYSVDSTSWVVTGRLGSIYIPKYANGKWIYDKNSWKISVSNKSPDLKNRGQHIDNISKLQKDIILKYIHEKGYVLGKSSFKTEKVDYELKENERWAEKKANVKNGIRKVEIIEEKGVSNTYQLRDEMNIIYFLDLEKTMQEWPWSFKVKSKNRLI